ncbi:lactate utilization protein C [Streptomyces sp. NPDC101234]|uniref:LutC/YkgG family protein n=1 Tax=Streptomyces sp. NPDC101234 TaxID=3366138 RepID=UPI00380A2773
MSSRERILGRVRRALADVRGEDAPVERAYLREHGERSVEETVELLAENLADYRAIVHRCTEGELAVVVGRLLAERGAKKVVTPAGLSVDWLAATDAEQVPDHAESTPAELDRVDSVVTGCAVAVAETGTIVLDGGPDQGRRRITLVPDHHICVVRVPDQVVSSVPQALDRLDPTRPSTWISGPSATSDIELDRVEGVHGPRTLEVVLVSGDRPSAKADS